MSLMIYIFIVLFSSKANKGSYFLLPNPTEKSTRHVYFIGKRIRSLRCTRFQTVRQFLFIGINFSVIFHNSCNFAPLV